MHLRFVRPALKAGGVGLIAALLVVVQMHTASASSSTGQVLTTSPVAVDLNAKPGTQTSVKLQVQNNSSRTLDIQVKLDEFKAYGDSGQAQIYSPPSGDPAVNWVHFSRTSFSADPGVWNSVTMTVDVPSSAAYGYYYAVLFEPQNASVNSEHNKIKGANAIFVLLNADNGNENNTLEINNFSSDKSLYQYLPANFTVTVHNKGNIYTAPQGSIFISRTKGGPAIASLDINPGQGNILPNTERTFHISWGDGFPAYQVKKVDGQIVSGKNGKPIQSLHWSGNISKFRFGKYYARLTLVYKEAGHDVPVSAEVSFWVIPWQVILVLVLILVLVGFGLWSLLKNSKKVYRWFGRK